MKHSILAFTLALGAAVAGATYTSAQAPAGGPQLSPERQAALAAQAELEKNTPQIQYDAVALPLMPT